jgi:hypothetical protein
VPREVVSTAEAGRELFRTQEESLLARPRMLGLGLRSDN